MCLAHTHHGSAPDDHSARLHLHLSGHSHASCSIGHSHGDSGEHQHPVEPLQDDTESSAGLNLCFPDHDCDAVYVGEQNTIQTQSRDIAANVASSASVWPVHVPQVTPQVAGTGSHGQVWRTRPFSPFKCALYLQTRCLLI